MPLISQRKGKIPVKEKQPCTFLMAVAVLELLSPCGRRGRGRDALGTPGDLAWHGRHFRAICSLPLGVKCFS